jgi:hypothetical protein
MEMVALQLGRAAADERPFFCSLHKCAILLNTWRKFKHISPLSYSSLEEKELSFIRKVTSFVFLLIISQCDLPAAVTLFCVIYITWFIEVITIYSCPIGRAV